MNYLMESCPKIYLNNPSEWNIQGYSKGGERTGFILFPLKNNLRLWRCFIYKSIACPCYLTLFVPNRSNVYDVFENLSYISTVLKVRSVHKYTNASSKLS